MVRFNLITFQNIQKKFGSNNVLTGVDFDIPEGERFGIIGVSGSGKTTLLNILIGFLKANSGRILLRAEDVTRNKAVIRRTFGFATQDCSFYDKLNVMENLDYYGKLYGIPKGEIKRRSEILLELVGLTDAKQTIGKNLSKGMKKRLDIACALIHDPQVLILDEPTEDLDSAMRRDILSLIRKINKLGTTIIITSHLLDEIEAICTKIAILNEGKIIKMGSPKELKGKYYKNDEIHIQTEPGNYLKMKKKLGKRFVDKVDCKENHMVVYTPNSEKVLHRMLHVVESSRENLIGVSVKKPSLEEVFEALTKRRRRK